MPHGGRRTENAEATRGALIGAARELFAAKGFGSTSMDDVAEAARVTKGAVYHHFRNKRDLFEAVFQAVEVDLVATIGRGPATDRDDPWEGLVRGVDTYLDACLDPEVQAILLVDGPTVLGWDRWRELEDHYGLGLTRAGLEVAMDAGMIKRQPAEPLAHMVFGALMEAAMYIARAPDRDRARAEIGATIRTLLEGLRA